jgi:predicted DNA-binding antitoxin AbrB/MazE fold protein
MKIIFKGKKVELKEGDKLAILVNEEAVEDFEYTVPEGKTAKIHIQTNITEE